MMLFVGHAESPWMARLRAVAAQARWLALGLALGAVIDVCVRLVVG
jgi:hypothetical protein